MIKPHLQRKKRNLSSIDIPLQMKSSKRAKRKRTTKNVWKRLLTMISSTIQRKRNTLMILESLTATANTMKKLKPVMNI